MDTCDIPLGRIEAGEALRFAVARLDEFARRLAEGRGAVRVLPPAPSRAAGRVHLTPEVFLVLRGANLVAAGGARVRVGEGEVMVVPPHTPHVEKWRERKGLFAFMVFCFYEQDVAGLHLTTHRAGRQSEPFFLRLHCPTRENLEALVQEASRAGRSGQPRAASRARWIVQALFGALADWLPEAVPLRKGNPRVAWCRTQVLLQLGDPDLTVRGLARQIGYHPDYLSRLFNAEHGLSLNRFIREERLSRAAHLLRTTDLPVKVIARMAGFSDPGYLDRCFRRRFGSPPRQYRLAESQSVSAG